MIPKRLTRVILVAGLLAVLAGCAAPTPNPTRSHSPAPSTSPTPDPTPTTASAPGSRVPLGCGGLLGTPALQAIAGPSPTVYNDETTAPTDIQSIAQLQYGALSCVFNDSGARGADVHIDVAPNAKAIFESRFAAIMADQAVNPHPTATQNVAGDQSGYWCATNVDQLGADRNLPICDAEILVSNYWVSVEIDTVSGFSRPQLASGLTGAMTDIAGKLTSAGPAPAKWAAPAGTPPTFCTDSSTTARIRSIVGDATVVPAKAPKTTLYASTVGLIGPAVSCAWTSKSYGYLDVDLLAGGSWAFPSIEPVATGDSVLAGHAYAPLDVSGATSAKVDCAQGVCGAFLAVGTTAVELNYKDPGAAKNRTVLAAFAKAIAAS